jgi:hypothetical protein
MSDRVRIYVYGLGVILFVAIGIVVFFILRAGYPYLFSNPSASNPSELVTNWLEAPTCKIPCWENITPGETNIEQAKSLLLSNPKIKNVRKGNVLPYGLMLSVDIQGDYYDPNASIGFDNNNIAQSIELFTSSQNLYLDDIVAYYGFPKYVVIYGQETVGVDVDLAYPEMGLVVNLYSQDAEIMNENDIRFTISPKQEVYGITFYAPNLEYYYSFAWQPLKRYDWKGFTNYP